MKNPVIISIIEERKTQAAAKEKISALGAQQLKTMVNEKNDAASTALHYACKYNQPELVEILIANEADRNQENIKGKKAIDYVNNNLINLRAISEDYESQKNGSTLAALRVVIEDCESEETSKKTDGILAALEENIGRFRDVENGSILVVFKKIVQDYQGQINGNTLIALKVIIEDCESKKISSISTALKARLKYFKSQENDSILKSLEKIKQECGSKLTNDNKDFLNSYFFTPPRYTAQIESAEKIVKLLEPTFK